jgi:hypothetical protein
VLAGSVCNASRVKASELYCTFLLSRPRAARSQGSLRGLRWPAPCAHGPDDPQWWGLVRTSLSVAKVGKVARRLAGEPDAESTPSAQYGALGPASPRGPGPARDEPSGAPSTTHSGTLPPPRGYPAHLPTGSGNAASNFWQWPSALNGKQLRVRTAVPITRERRPCRPQPPPQAPAVSI